MDRINEIAFAILFALLLDKKLVVKFAPALAKLYVTLDQLVQLIPTLAGEVAKRKPQPE